MRKRAENIHWCVQKRGRTERRLACEANSLVAWENGRHFTVSRNVGCFSQFFTVPSERLPPQSPPGFTAHVAKLATRKIISNSLRAPQWVKPGARNLAQLEWRNKGVFLKNTIWNYDDTAGHTFPKSSRQAYIYIYWQEHPKIIACVQPPPPLRKNIFSGEGAAVHRLKD